MRHFTEEGRVVQVKEFMARSNIGNLIQIKEELVIQQFFLPKHLARESYNIMVK